MKQITTEERAKFWQFEQLASERRLRHLVTDRNSAPSERQFTLSFSSSPDRDEILRNRGVLQNALGARALFFPSQVHKTRVVHVRSSTKKEELQETDALITNEPGIGIAVMSADCVPILLYDREHHVAAAVHSGWRGTVARILSVTLREMADVYGTDGKDILAGIGPSVSQAAYEVGQEVVAEVERAFPGTDSLLIPQPGNKARLDLWGANQLQLLDFGVPASNIEISRLCTVNNNNDFFSARKGDTGRFAAALMLL